MKSSKNPWLRHVVLVAEDLRVVTAQLRDFLGLLPGVDGDMSHLGLDHEVLTIGDTFLEVLTPRPDAEPGPAGRALQRDGDGGYMAIVQVDDAAATGKRAEAAGLRVVHEGTHAGNSFVQYHPKEAGTLLETDQIRPPESWHFAPEIFGRACTDVSEQIVRVTIATPEPRAVAERWSVLLDVSAPGSASLDLGGVIAEFVEGPGRGVTGLEIKAAETERRGDTADIGGITIRMV